MTRQLQGTVVSLTTGCRTTEAESSADRCSENQKQEGQVLLLLPGAKQPQPASKWSAFSENF